MRSERIFFYVKLNKSNPKNEYFLLNKATTDFIIDIIITL